MHCANSSGYVFLSFSVVSSLTAKHDSWLIQRDQWIQLRTVEDVHWTPNEEAIQCTKCCSARSWSQSELMQSIRTLRIEQFQWNYFHESGQCDWKMRFLNDRVPCYVNCLSNFRHCFSRHQLQSNFIDTLSGCLCFRFELGRTAHDIFFVLFVYMSKCWLYVLTAPVSFDRFFNKLSTKHGKLTQENIHNQSTSSWLLSLSNRCS